VPNVKCFMIEPTDRARRFLRRFTYRSNAPCPVNSWGHEASVRIEDAPLEGLTERGSYFGDAGGVQHSDRRWPKKCEACGAYKFKNGDEWQVTQERIYRRQDTGEECTLRDAPTGAMWYADWMSEGMDASLTGPGTFKGPDGRCLYVMVPGNHPACLDGPATNGPGWTRTGTPPDVTASPSIWADAPTGWHGWLRDGELIEA
jgi:hypothetical protein